MLARACTAWLVTSMRYKHALQSTRHLGALLASSTNVPKSHLAHGQMPSLASECSQVGCGHLVKQQSSAKQTHCHRTDCSRFVAIGRSDSASWNNKDKAHKICLKRATRDKQRNGKCTTNRLEWNKEPIQIHRVDSDSLCKVESFRVAANYIQSKKKTAKKKQTNL